MKNNISLLIHGPLDGHCLELIRGSIDSSSVRFCEITVVSYAHDYAEYSKIMKSVFGGLEYKVIQIKDLINPGFANINRHVTQVNAGLGELSMSSFVIKLRNDQSVDFKKLFGCIAKYKLFQGEGEKKILTTNCFTRRDRYYHPSDMFMAAPHGMMTEYFCYPTMQETEIMIKMQVAEMFTKNPAMTFNPVSPESELFRNFLKKNDWDILETEEDSLSALKKYVYVLNSWDIDLRWNKARNYPFKKKNEIILPHFFTMAPFPGAPVENHSCYMRDEIIGGVRNRLDNKYISSARKMAAFMNAAEKLKLKLPRIKKRFHGIFRALFSLFKKLPPFKKPYMYFDRQYQKYKERIRRLEETQGND